MKLKSDSAMGQLSFDQITPEETQRLLNTLNGFRTGEEIVEFFNRRSSESNYGVGIIVARRIIRKRRTLRGRRFTRLTQLNGIPGLGQEKFDDFTDAIRISSAQSLVQELYGEEILFENWRLKFHAIELETEEAFLANTKDFHTLRKIVAENIQFLADDGTPEGALEEARDQINSLEFFMDGYQSGHVASYVFAVWFYRYDEDNWFSFERIRAPLEAYLGESYHSEWRPIFNVLKGFDNQLILKDNATLPDLPIVLNQEEKSIYLWSVQLFD